MACEVIKAVDTDWINLKISLDISDYVMLDILNQRTMQQQVFRYITFTIWHTYVHSIQLFGVLLSQITQRMEATFPE